MTRFGLDGDMKAAEEDCYLVSDLITTVFVQQPLAKTVGLLRIKSLKLISSHAYNNKELFENAPPYMIFRQTSKLIFKLPCVHVQIFTNEYHEIFVSYSLASFPKSI